MAAAKQSSRQAPAATTTKETDPHEEAGKKIVSGWIDAPIEFIPFGKEKAITLTPRRVIQFFAKPTRKGDVCSYEQAMKFCQLCKSRGLDPWEGDAFIVGFDGQDGPEFNLITAHQAFLKRAEACPEFDGMESGIVVKRGTETIEYEGDLIEPGDAIIGGWARVHRRDRKIATYRRVALTTFDSGRSRWNKDKAGMIVKCAEADALRSTFPNKVGGLYTEHEADFGFTEEREPVKMPKAIEEPKQQQADTEPAEEIDESGPVPPVRQQSFAETGANAERM